MSDTLHCYDWHLLWNSLQGPKTFIMLKIVLKILNKQQKT